MDVRRTTCVFNYVLEEFPGNPHHAETPFGQPARISIGDACADLDELEERYERLRAAAAPVVWWVSQYDDEDWPRDNQLVAPGLTYGDLRALARAMEPEGK